MATYDLAIRGGTVVTSGGRALRDVYVRDGRIVRLDGDPAGAAQDVDAAGLLVLPGMVDTHVHLMDPGDNEREDFPTGSAAAGARGVTTVIEHTHSHPVRTVDELAGKRRYLQGRSHVDYGLAAHVWPDHLDELAGLWAEGIALFKVFTCTTHGVPGLRTPELREAFARIAAFDGRCLVHCEDEDLTAADLERLQAQGRTDPGILPEWRSRLAEILATQAVAAIAESTGVAATVAHVSHPAVVRVVQAARFRGADIGAEACPQYFLLREHDVFEHGALRKFTPPARARSDHDLAAMWTLLHEGAFSHVSTDHAHATREQKAGGDLWDAHFGLPGLDTTMPILLDLALRGQLALEQLVLLYSEAPARRYGLHPRKGSLLPGADADLVLVDPAGKRTLTDDEVISKAGWTPYAGRAIAGAVRRVFLRGREIAQDDAPADGLSGRFVAGPGSARR